VRQSQMTVQGRRNLASRAEMAAREDVAGAAGSEVEVKSDSGRSLNPMLGLQAWKSMKASLMGAQVMSSR
jgi:hypothetical protein